MVKSKMNKSESIRQYMVDHKDARVPDIAKALDVQAGLVYQVKASLKSGKSGKKAAKQKVRPTAEQKVQRISTVTGLGTIQVIAAANLIKSCGNADQARQAIKAAEKVAKALD